MIGGLDWVGLSGVGAEPHPNYGPTIPHQAFVLFQLMFAAIAPALITGAFAERKRFTSVVLFAAIWSLVVYVPLVHWIWGGDGWPSWAPWILPAARSSTSAPARRPLSARLCWASGEGMGRIIWHHTIFR